jgi:outer membrane immunogenic protein
VGKGLVMKNLLLSSIAFTALLTGPTMAAPVYSWAGFYVGANLGGSWGNSGNDWNFISNDPSMISVGRDSNHLFRGAVGGLEAGYNWQIANYLFGIETDIELSGLKGSKTFDATPLNGVPVGPASLSAAYTEKLQWLGTLRGRVGYAAGGLLVYGTGGLAYGQVSMNGSATLDGLFTGTSASMVLCSGANDTTSSYCPFANWSNNATRVGWTLGAGVEGALFGNWTVKIEYLHVDLGNVSTTFATDGVFPGQGSINSRITDDIVRLGLNYKFGYVPTATK